MRIFRRGLTSTEWATPAGLLFKAEYSATPAKHKETERGRPVPCIDLQDTKKAAPGGNDTESGKANKTKLTVPQEEGAVNDP